MRSHTTKIDNASGQNAGQLGATEFNDLVDELERVVTGAGITLDSASTTQLSEAVWLYATKGGSMAASGSPNAIVVTPQGGAAGPVVPTTLSDMDGVKITFAMPFTNTGAVTIDGGQTGAAWGSKKFLDDAGADFSASALSAGQRVTAIYDSTADSSNGAWVATPWGS